MSETSEVTAYSLAGPDIVHEEFDGDMVILNLSCGQYFGLNESGALLWKAIAEGHEVTRIAALTGRGEELAEFVGKLRGFGLILPAETATPMPDDLALALGGAAPGPTVDCYDDLADLIIADPIHDTDPQAGWPKRPDTP
ncbi:PqqD family protein [Oceanicola sp. S124]|uniref:PqqD family protein n=1 Tax=Oceanicola sp. S124 TaxID=1042378 RepID=UPI0002557D59|nr:PqqD family protein [Oceanicola sp. S124]